MGMVFLSLTTRPSSITACIRDTAVSILESMNDSLQAIQEKTKHLNLQGRFKGITIPFIYSRTLILSVGLQISLFFPLVVTISSVSLSLPSLRPTWLEGASGSAHCPCSPGFRLTWLEEASGSAHCPCSPRGTERRSGASCSGTCVLSRTGWMAPAIPNNKYRVRVGSHQSILSLIPTSMCRWTVWSLYKGDVC